MTTLEDLWIKTKKIALIDVIPPIPKKVGEVAYYIFCGILAGGVLSVYPISCILNCNNAKPLEIVYNHAVRRYGDINSDGFITSFEQNNFDIYFQLYMAGKYYKGWRYIYENALDPQYRTINSGLLGAHLNQFGREYLKRKIK